MNLRKLRWGIWSVCSVLLVIAGIQFYKQSQTAHYVRSTPTELPKLGGPFRLTDQFGRIVDSEQLKGRYVLVYFGYTYCPDICPLGLHNLTGALTLLKRDAQEIVPLFITVDPERDTIETLKLYAQNWHKSVRFLTGSRSELDPVLKSYKVYAVKAEQDETMSDYLIDHSALIYLLDRDGTFIDYFPHTIHPGDLARALQKRLLQEKSMPPAP